MARRPAALLLLLLPLLTGSCRTPDPKQELEIKDLETYWAVDRPLGETQFLAPVLRFRVRNKGREPHRSIEATATFRRKGEEQVWSGAFWQNRSRAGAKPVLPGDSVLVVLKPDGEGRYKSTGPPGSMLTHPEFKDVSAEIFLRVGSSGWVKMGAADVERRIGSRSVTSEAP